MGEYSFDKNLRDLTRDERKHVADMFWALTARRSISKLARKELDEVPGPSLSTSIGHIRELVERFRNLGELRAILVQVLSWDNPAQTITAMMVYTTICHNPHLITCLPLLAIILGVFVPNYARKFPYSGDRIPLPHHRNFELVDEQDAQELVPDQRHEQAERDVIKGLRDAQASLSKLCDGLEKFDKFKAGPGNFEEPGASSALYLVLLFGTINVAYFSSFIDITQLFVGTGLLVFILAHPQVKAYLAEMEPMQLQLTLVSRIVKRISSQFVFDDPPFIRTVEIFELQKQGLTPRMWDTVSFTPVVYSEISPYRLSHQYPPGSESLKDVSCPADWTFREDDVWVEDPESENWVRERGIYGLTPSNSWAIDNSSEFRRRRLTRACYYDPK